ncbi:mechanosensitive ion channel family protein [Woodsholea maritima]|uniref:mechanosensitive ion channel family protein n=1 Tax=Woodsholea maritima TaxID=240237 RepID=UPI00036A2E07|nr:mechanosensitive ion channel domain-containing protein [Woodsholea maritima]
MEDKGFDLAALAQPLMFRGLELAINVGLAALIFVVGMFIAGFASRMVRRAAERNPRIDKTLSSFFSSVVKYAIMAVVFISVLNRFGVQTTSIVAALGAATLAIGLALQGTLSNLAAGVMIVFFRPYRIGDFVEIAGTSGTVKEITLFTTELATPDNKQIIVPNGNAWGQVITNYSFHATRRVDFTFGISYDDDINKAMSVIREVVAKDTRIHAEPEAFLGVLAHNTSSIDIVTRVWCNTEDYWGIYFDTMKAVKEAFDANGIEIPYPHQVEIHKGGEA